MNSLIDTDQEDQPQIDPAKDYYAELVGEGKKFKTVQDLARGKAEADAYIEMQNRQKDQLRDDYLKLREEHMKGASMQALVDQLKASLQPDNRDNTLDANKKETPPVLDPTQLDSLVSKKIQEHEILSKQQKNFNEVRSKLQEQYGSRHTDVLKKQLDELGLTVEEADRMARNSPKAFYKTFGLETQAEQSSSFNAPPRSNVRSDNFAPNVPKRDYAYYQKLRKENPNLYWEPKTQVQMHEDHEKAVLAGIDFGI